MTPEWAAEWIVSPDLCRSLIHEQFPQLAPAHIEFLAAGWDNTAYQVNGAFVFRFPRRKIALPCLEVEVKLLPMLTSRLPLPAPAISFVGLPSAAFPNPFVGYPMIPGQTASSKALDDGQRAALAAPLGRFLAALHAVCADEAALHGAPWETLGRLDLNRQIPKAHERLERLRGLGVLPDTTSLTAILEAAPAKYSPRRDILVHGDLYARQLLVDDERRLTGVIDWGDLHLGDPAVDLAVAHSFLPPSAHDTFRQNYGPIDAATWQMARQRALWHSLAVLSYGHDTGEREVADEALQALHYLSGRH